MKPRAASTRFFGEAVIFLFPLFSEFCAFGAAIYVKTSGFENGSGLLFLLAAIKLAASILEYKGFEEAYLQKAFGPDSVFARIGLLQLIQGLILPAGIIFFAQLALSWRIDALFVSLLVWTGIITSVRQFVAYHWRAQLKGAARSGWLLWGEIALAYAWLGFLTAAALGSHTPYARELAWLAESSWKLWVIFVLVLFFRFLNKSGRHLANGLSSAQWVASIGQSFTAQLSKEFFILVTTSSLTAGFIARIVVTIYGLVVVYPLTFFRLRIFDHHASQPANHVMDPMTAKAADLRVRKVGLLLGGCLLALLPLAGYLRKYSGIDFPFSAALLALGLTYPLVAFDVLAYFALIKRDRRSKYSTACAAGGLFAVILGFIVARSVSDANLLAFLFITLLGLSDFIVNRVTKSLAYR